MRNPFHPDGPLLRRLAVLGASRGPTWLLRGAPPVLGPLFWALRPQHRRGVRRNLRRAVGPRPKLGAMRDEVRTFVNFARSMAEGIAALGPRRTQARVEVTGAERFYELDGARGCVLLTAHTSGFELAGALLAERLCREVVVVMRAEASEASRRISDAIREQGGLRVVHAGDDATVAMELVGHLRRGACVALQMDRVPAGMKSVPVRLFGQPAEVPLGPFALARAAGVPLVPVFTRRTGFLSVAVQLAPPITLPPRADRAQLADAAQQATSHLEAWIRSYPTEWFDWGQRG